MSYKEVLYRDEMLQIACQKSANLTDAAAYIIGTSQGTNRRVIQSGMFTPIAGGGLKILYVRWPDGWHLR
jgi:hypothetical protein